MLVQPLPEHPPEGAEDEELPQGQLDVLELLGGPVDAQVPADSSGA